MQKVEGSNPFSRFPANGRLLGAGFVLTGPALSDHFGRECLEAARFARMGGIAGVELYPAEMPEVDSRRHDEAWRETKEILADPGTMAVLVDGLRELDRGEVISLADLRRELDAARPGFD